MPTEGFELHVQTLAGQNNYLGRAAAAPGVAARLWQLPPASPADGTDVQHPDFFVVAMERADLNDEYAVAVSSADPTLRRRGRAMATKAAADYMGAYERALHARHASPARCRAWAGARRGGHGDAVDGVLGAVLRQLRTWDLATPPTTETDLTTSPTTETELVGEG